VQNAYKVTLVAAFVPLVAGAYWKRASMAALLVSIVLGLLFWIGAEFTLGDSDFPPQLVGFLAAIVGMVIGSLAPQIVQAQGQSIAQALREEAHHKS